MGGVFTLALGLLATAQGPSNHVTDSIEALVEGIGAGTKTEKAGTAALWKRLDLARIAREVLADSWDTLSGEDRVRLEKAIGKVVRAQLKGAVAQWAGLPTRCVRTDATNAIRCTSSEGSIRIRVTPSGEPKRTHPWLIHNVIHGNLDPIAASRKSAQRALQTGGVDKLLKSLARQEKRLRLGNRLGGR